MVSILFGVWNGGGVCCCCPAQCSGVARALLIPLQCWRVLLSCRVLFLPGAWCVGGGCVSVVFVWQGILCVLPPRRGGGWGHRGQWVAWRMVGGIVSEGRRCRVDLPVCVWCPPSVCVVVPLNGGGGGLCVVPVFGLDLPLLHCLSSPSLLPTVYVLCHSIVGLVLCLCDRVVSLWNRGDGLCGAEGRVVSTVHCQLFMCCGVCFSVVCVLSCCAVLWVVECRWWAGVCLVVCFPILSVFLFFLFVLVFGVVRAQPCEHARYPRTPLRLSCCVLSSLLFVLRFSLRPAFLVIVEWRWVTHHVLVCCVGMTATGSLSLSFSFFW